MWSYDSAYARECLAWYIVQTDQPINFGESVFYEEFIQKAFNPQFKDVSKTTTENDLKKWFYTERNNLITELHHLSVSIALTYDIWSACSK